MSGNSNPTLFKDQHDVKVKWVYRRRETKREDIYQNTQRKGLQKFAARTAAPPASNSAAVGTAAATAPPFRGMFAGTNVVVGTIPEVNGASATAATPANAGACVGADGTGVAEVLEGLRTLQKIPD